MTTVARLEASPMLIVECPLCDGPAVLDADTAELDCPGCGVWLPLADQPATPSLPAAA